MFLDDGNYYNERILLSCVTARSMVLVVLLSHSNYLATPSRLQNSV